MILPDNFNREEINLHRASQLISLTGVNLMDALPDDSQNTAIWNEQYSTLLGRKFELNKKRYQLAIRFIPFELVLLDEKSLTIKSIDIGGLDQPALYSIWEDWLINLGFKGNLITKLHYDLPENEHYNSNQFDGLTQDFAKSWSSFRSLANEAMRQLNELSGIKSEINIWPHHFDTGVYYPLKEIKGETTQSIGAGFGIADSMINEPYFYLYGWSKDGEIDYVEAPTLTAGEWLTKEWQGAVLKISDTSSIIAINEFYEASYQFILKQLKK